MISRKSLYTCGWLPNLNLTWSRYDRASSTLSLWKEGGWDCAAPVVRPILLLVTVLTEGWLPPKWTGPWGTFWTICPELWWSCMLTGVGGVVTATVIDVGADTIDLGSVYCTDTGVCGNVIGSGLMLPAGWVTGASWWWIIVVGWAAWAGAGVGVMVVPSR